MLILMFPGSLELIQDSVHWVLDGHTLHESKPEHNDHGPSEEHSCSGTYHVCMCHSSTLFIARSTVHTSFLRSSHQCEVIEFADEPCPSAYLDRLFRPPTA